MSRWIKNFFVLLGAITFIGFILSVFGASQFMKEQEKLSKNSILHLKLNGIILGEDQFLKDLIKYRDKEQVKGVLVEINSPGGVVGPSQEIYTELKRVRDELQKPVVVTSSGLMASGAYYAAVAADKIVVNPGTMVGSIGVIMNFANLEKLYSWAKIERYAITTGPYKDAGADYRAMTEAEKNLFREMIGEVHHQFKTAVSEGRKLPMDKVEAFSDGRVFTGRLQFNTNLPINWGHLKMPGAWWGPFRV
ncbi:MAG: signal peptide peptidase SppA [Bdellovibrionales bacterium]